MPQLLHISRMALELGKARLSAANALAAAAGFWIARPADGRWAPMIWLLAGTWLTALGANAGNQCIERRRDALMRRTRSRPLPSGRIGLAAAWAVSLAMLGAGLGLLAWKNGWLPAALGAGGAGIYLALYTPLKVRTPFCTLIGSLAGAAPPLMGWAAARGELDFAAWALAAAMALWQAPHFLALAWGRQEDYARAGYRLWPLADPTGRRAALLALVYSLALAPAALALCWTGVGGAVFAVGAAALCLGLAAVAAGLAMRPGEKRASLFFRAGLLFPLAILGLLAVERSLAANADSAGIAAPPPPGLQSPLPVRQAALRGATAPRER